MNKKVLDYINRCEGWKTAIKSLHWDSNSLSQHELCDDIAESIAEFQDTVSEVEQSITGKLKVNSLKPTEYKIKNLKSFVQDVLDETNTFYKEIKDMGDTYVGMASDCESFLSDMQRKLYLVNFTLKEELKERLRDKINESMPKNLSRHDEVDKFMGRKPKSIKARINQIYRIVKKYGIDSKIYHDENWQAISDYYRAISSLGCEVAMKPCGELSHADSIESDGGYTDYAEDGMPRSKQYAIKIMFEDGMNIDGYIKCMAAGTMENPFERYDTCIVLWPKNNRELTIEMKEDRLHELGVGNGKTSQNNRQKMAMIAKRKMQKGDAGGYGDATTSIIKGGGSHVDLKDFQEKFEESKQFKLSETQLKQLVKEAAIRVLTETPLNYDVDNFSGRWIKPSNGYDLTSGEEYIDDEGYLDNPYKHDEIENALADDEWEWGKDMDMKGAENEYSWDRFEHKPIAPGLDPYYSVGKRVVPREVDNAIAMKNKQGDWRDNELRHGRRMMDKWVNGQRDDEDLEDGWDDLQYINRESKEPMKVTENELKTIVKEAASKIISEIGDTLNGAYKIGKLAARQDHRDREPMKSAKTLACGLKSAPKDDKEYDRWANAAKEGYSDGKKEFNPSENVEEGDSGIHIKPSKEGTFTAAATKHGESVQGFASKVLNNKDDYSPAMVKKANFARNAKKFKH